MRFSSVLVELACSSSCHGEIIWVTVIPNLEMGCGVVHIRTRNFIFYSSDNQWTLAMGVDVYLRHGNFTVHHGDRMSLFNWTCIVRWWFWFGERCRWWGGAGRFGIWMRIWLSVGVFRVWFWCIILECIANCIVSRLRSRCLEPYEHMMPIVEGYGYLIDRNLRESNGTRYSWCVWRFPVDKKGHLM